MSESVNVAPVSVAIVTAAAAPEPSGSNCNTLVRSFQKKVGLVEIDVVPEVMKSASVLVSAAAGPATLPKPNQ